MPARIFLFATVALLLGQHVAVAHSSLESTLSFWTRPTGIDVQIYMSRGSAAVLLEEPGEHITILRDNFPTFEQRLATAGPTLLSLTTADGSTLTAEASTASITDEDDICYRLHYPLPKVVPGTPGSLTIHGNYLEKMDAGHVGSIYVLSAANEPLAQGEIRADSPDFQSPLPAVAAPVAQPPPAAQPAPAPSTNAPHGEARWVLWAALACSALLITIAAMRAFIRQNANLKTKSRPAA
jgi:hypothetical protein